MRPSSTSRVAGYDRKRQGGRPGPAHAHANAISPGNLAFLKSFCTQVVTSRTHTGNLSAFAAAAAQVCSEPDSPPALILQSSQARVAQLQQPHSGLQAQSVYTHPPYQEPLRAATAPHIAPSAARISPWAANYPPANASADNAAAPLAVDAAAYQLAEPAPSRPPSKEEHRVQLVQLLEDACRQAPTHQPFGCRGNSVYAHNHA